MAVSEMNATTGGLRPLGSGLGSPQLTDALCMRVPVMGRTTGSRVVGCAELTRRPASNADATDVTPVGRYNPAGLIPTP
ncbi:hypothetical protein ACNTMW_06000 [Planosporangium sp. 12N6]|uniref:hypothetical protein n=1 Tax=Planosporangium spinosum TaxID=3402278 RepID=UPI003CF17D56